jgi:hypothetical protein
MPRHRRRGAYFCRRIAGRKMLASRVSLAAIGSLKKLPNYSDIELGLLDKEVRKFI